MANKGFKDENHYFGISIIIITYNEEENIKDCLDSILKIDYPKGKYEVIVVDASDDSTPEIVSKYRSVKLIKSPKGFSQQRNTGWKNAVYDIIAFADADSIIPSEYLKVINRSFKNKSVSAIGGNAYPPPSTNRFGIWAAFVGHPAGGSMGFKANMEKGQKKAVFLPGCNFVFRREALKSADGFDPEFYDGGEDVDISRRLYEKGFLLKYIPDLTVFHKPRNSLIKYIKWNVGVGITKFNLKHPSLMRLIFHPSFPLWSLIPVAVFFSLLDQPLLLFVVLGLGWTFYLILLYVFTNPFPHLLRQRKQIGGSLIAVLFIVPLLIYLRQISINIGQIKKWRSVKTRKSSS